MPNSFGVAPTPRLSHAKSAASSCLGRLIHVGACRLLRLADAAGHARSCTSENGLIGRGTGRPAAPCPARAERAGSAGLRAWLRQARLPDSQPAVLALPGPTRPAGERRLLRLGRTRRRRAKASRRLSHSTLRCRRGQPRRRPAQVRRQHRHLPVLRRRGERRDHRRGARHRGGVARRCASLKPPRLTRLTVFAACAAGRAAARRLLRRDTPTAPARLRAARAKV